MFAALTGLRAVELKRVTSNIIHPAPPGSPAAGLLKLPAEMAKTRNARIIGLTSEALDIVERARARGPHDDGTLFGPMDRRSAFNRASRKLGVKPVITLRDLRHTFGTNSLERGGDLKATMATMGHKTMAAADLYQSTTEDRNVRATMAAAQHLMPKVEQLGRSSAKLTDKRVLKKPVKSTR